MLLELELVVLIESSFPGFPVVTVGDIVDDPIVTEGADVLESLNCICCTFHNYEGCSK